MVMNTGLHNIRCPLGGLKIYESLWGQHVNTQTIPFTLIVRMHFYSEHHTTQIT